MLTNLRDAFGGQSRSPNIVPFHMLGIVSYCATVTLSLRRAVFTILRTCVKRKKNGRKSRTNLLLLLCAYPYVVTCNIFVLYFLNCTKFVQLLFWKIVKIVATRCQILMAKMHQIRF